MMFSGTQTPGIRCLSKIVLTYFKNDNNSNYTRFTKRHFVRHKNPQKLEEAYIIQFLLLSLNMDSVFKFLQRSPNGSQFSFFFKNFTYNFCCLFPFFQIVANFIMNHPTFFEDENKNIGLKSARILLLTGHCGA